MKTKLCWLVLCLQLLAWRPAAAAIPWHDGEQLTYEVHWGVIVAAEGTFVATKHGPEWFFDLDLKSRGVVEDMVRIRSKVSSVVTTNPWTPRLFEADRHEGSHNYKYCCRTGAGPEENGGTYTNLLKESDSRVFDLPGAATEDFVSMLYHFRWHDWDKQPSLDFDVNDRWKVYHGRAKLLRMVDLTDAAGQKRRCYVIEAKEVKDGKLVDKYALRLWIPKDDKRIPLLARLEFKYGTFTIKPKLTE